MLRIIVALLFGLSAASAQTVGPPQFPQTLPSNTVVGRTQAGTGPASAIAFPNLAGALTPYLQSIGAISNPIAALTKDQQATSALAGGGSAPVWNRLGVALQPNNTSCAGTQKVAQEHGVIYDTNPVILTGNTNVFKMWYHAGWTSDQINYAESADGLNWTCYSGNPVIGVANPAPAAGYTMVHSVVKTGTGTYRLYPKNETTGNLDLYTCTGSVNCTLTQASVLSPGAGGTWDTNGIGNAFVWQEGPTTWHMLYFGHSNLVMNCPSNNFAIGLANSSDGVTWTKYVSNPVLDDHCASGPFVYKALSGTYYLWDGMTGDPNENPLGDMSRWTSTDLHTWTRSPSATFTFARSGSDEGYGNTQGGVTDPSLTEVNGVVYMLYVAQPDQSGNYNPIKLAVADMPLETLITTNEGFLPLVPGGYGNPFSVGKGADGEHVNIQNTGKFAFLGFGCAFNSTGSIVQDIASIPCAWMRFQQQGTNASASWNLAFVNVAGSETDIADATMQSGGTPDKFSLYGDTLCFNHNVGGTCDQSIGFWFDGALTTGNGGVEPWRMGWFDFPAETTSKISGSGAANMWDDSTTHRLSMSSNAGAALSVAGIIAQGTSAVGGNSITSLACDSVVTTSATGTLTTDSISWAFNAAPGTNWPKVTVQAYPTADHVNFLVCNPSAGSTTPASATLNWSVIR